MTFFFLFCSFLELFIFILSPSDVIIDLSASLFHPHLFTDNMKISYPLAKQGRIHGYPSRVQRAGAQLIEYLSRGSDAKTAGIIRTRPDTRLPKSRAGGQGPYLRSPDNLGRSREVKEIKS